jgi:hypothetical protein
VKGVRVQEDTQRFGRHIFYAASDHRRLVSFESPLATRKKNTGPLMARISPFTNHFSPFTSAQTAIPSSDGTRLAQSPPNS